MENFIFRKKRKMDEVKHKDKVKELQEKYIPFLDQIIRRLQSTEDGKSREAQLKKMQSLHDLLKNKPKTLKLEVLEKTEQVLKTLYQKFGPKKLSENTEDDDPDGSKIVALGPTMEVDRIQNQVDLAVVKQKLLHANEASMSREVDGRGNNVIDALKQKASAIIGDKVRPTDPRLERRAVTSEITLQFNKISTVISSRDNRNMFNARPDPVPPAGYPIPLANFQGGQQSVNLFCRRQDQTVYQQGGYPMKINGPPNPSINAPNPGPSRQICPQPLPDNPAMRADLNILNSPPLSNDDIESLMGGPSETPHTSGSTTTIRKSETVRFAVQYHQNPAKKSFDKSSSHLPIDQSGNITVSLDDPRLKKPLAPPRSDPRGDPRRDPRFKRNDPPPVQKTVSRYENRKPIDTRALEYKCNNPAPPKKIYNPMERRSELDDDYIDSSQYSAVKTPKNNFPDRKKFDKLKAIESAPRVSQSCDSTQALTSQFDDMYRKNEFTEDYDKKVKTINKGIQSFKIPKKAPTKSEKESDENSKLAGKESDKQSAPTKENKLEKTVEKTVEGKSKEPSDEKPKKKKKKKKQSEEDSVEKSDKKSSDKEVSSKTKDSKKKDSSDSDETTKKKSRKRIVILSEAESENSDLDSETFLGERVPVGKTKPGKTKKAAAETEVATKKKSVAVSEEKNEEDASQTGHRSQTVTPEPVSSSSQVEMTEKRYTSESPSQIAHVEADTAKDGITKEWLEGFLSNMFSPNNYTKNKLLDIMKTVLDDKKFEQVKSIFESGDDKTEDKGETSKEEQPKSDKVSEEKSDAVAESSDQPKSHSPEDKPKKKKKNRELERLNEDIRTMFISEGVLTATGRRMCTALRRKPLSYNESTPPSSPTKELKNNEEEPVPSKPDPVETKPLPGPKSKRGRKKKQTEEPKAEEEEVNVEISEKNFTGSDIARKFLEEKRLDINRLLKVELHKLNESEIAQSTTPKRKRKAGRKKAGDDTTSVSESSTPKKKKFRRNNIWFRNPKKKVKNPRSAGVAQSEEIPIETAELPEPPLRKKPGPKSKTQNITSPESKKSDSVAAAPMDIDYKAIKKENAKMLFDVKNTDITVTAVNQKACKICGYGGKTVVSHYVKAHPLHEVFCSRLPKNISDFLKKHENGMLYAESYNMKLQYSGSKIFGHCIFCREEMYEPPSGWVTHFTKHTGEYEFQCSCGYKTWVAKVIRTHVKKCSERGSYVTNVISRDEGKHIEAYICDECNFVQLQEENVRNHVITQHLTAPEVHKVCLLNFSDESVKKNHSIFLEMYKQNAAALEENQEEGVFKTTDEKDNEETTSKSILDDISKTIPNEPVSGIANKLHERFGEKPKIKVDVDDVMVKAEESANEEITLSESGVSSQETESMDHSPVPMDLDPPPTLDDNNDNPDNPIEHDDDEWEDIESDSDESMQGLPGRAVQNKKLSRLAQKMGIKSGAKRKTDDAVESGSSKKSKTDVPVGSVTTTDAESIITENPPEEGFESGKVENLLFKFVDGQPQYECLMKKCLYITSSMELFIDHLIRVHDEDTWSGYCHLCQEDKFLSTCTMVKEFHHLVNEHNWKNPPEKFSATSDQIKEEARPAIRLRRLSGDKLSSQMNSFKVPTTPTHIRSVTIRRVSKSPEVSSATTTTGSPPAAVVAQPGGSPRGLSTSGSLVIKRTLASGASSSAVSVGRLSDISTTEPLQTLKSIALSIPSTQSIDNADVANTKVYEGPMQSAKIIGRRSTIAADRPEQAIMRISNANELKPWTKQQCSKSATTASKMLEQEVIYSPFKCMGSECWYFTTRESEMVSHLKSHDKTSEEESEQTTVIDTCSWLECSYCDYMAGSTNDLMNHLKKEHLHCEFLCPKCFYRACHVNYVARHMLVYHETDSPTVWRIKPDYSVTSILNPVTCVKENVKLLTCKTCNLKFLNYIHFESHIKEHGSSMFECIFCLVRIRIENIKKHLFCHSIGNFECIYCDCAMINKNNLAQHLCDKHPNKSLLYYNREQAQEHVDKFKLSHFDNFGPKCVNVKFVKRDTLPKSIHKFPVGISVTRHTPAPQLASPNKEPPAVDNSLPLVISNVVSLNTKPKSSPAPPSSFLVIKDVCSLPKETPSTAGAKPSGFTTLMTNALTTESLENQGPFAKAMARVIADWVMKSGSSMKVLLKCSENNCDYQANGRGEFLEHVDRSHQNAMLKCPQCVNVFWHSSTSLWNHLETHGQKRYFCIACDFTGRSEQLVAEHCTKLVHSWLGYITVLLTNVPEGGVYLLCPMNTSQAKIDTFKSNFVRNIQKNAVSSVADKRDAADTYGPDDIDKLPTKPVVARNIMCKLCNYKTMIVKNLVRHFDAHQQAVSLPRLDPVNPVPCLSEKNFDKMTNLACSSNMDRSKTNEPAFVVQQKRFVCGVSTCSYITIDDIMLRSHLSTLHSAETAYKCPHCSLELIKGVFSVETIVAHYRLHGPKLFMCDKCQFMSETTVTVEKHIKGVHSGTGSIYILRDDSKNDAAVSELAVAEESSLPKKWICSECKETTYLKCDMANHVATLHGHKYQYICGYCSMGHPTRHYVVDHVKLRHGSNILVTETYSAIKGGGSLKKHVESVNFWRRDDKGAKSIRGIPCEASEMPREDEEDEEESDEEFLPDRDTLVAVAKNVESELARRKLEGSTFEDDTVAEQMKQQSVNRLIQCTICGKTTLSALTMQIVHFPDCHPGVPVSTRTIMSSGKVEEPKQKPKETTLDYTGYMFKCFYCSFYANTVDEFKFHYVGEHSDEPETPRCLFFVIKTMYCGLCQEVCDSYDVVAKHLLAVHKTDSVIAKNTKDSMICGACNYNAGDDQNLLRHAKLRHTNPLGSSSTAKHAVTQVVLEQMLQIKMYPMKRCSVCREVICDIDGSQIEDHLRTKHSASMIATFVGIHNFTLICSVCDDMFESETVAFTHILTHVKSFKCAICNEFFYTYEKTEEHLNEKHNGDASKIMFAWPTDVILQTLIIFPNGLIMSLGELQLTKHGFNPTKYKLVRSEVMIVRHLKITNSELVT